MALTLLEQARLMENPLLRLRATAALAAVASEHLAAPLPESRTRSNLDRLAERIALAVKVQECPAHWVAVMAPRLGAELARMDQPKRLTLEDSAEGMKEKDVEDVDKAVLDVCRKIWDEYLTTTVPR